MLLSSFLFLFSGCMATKVPPKPEISRTSFREVKRAVVLTPGVTIEAEDKSFLMKYNIPVRAPFSQGGDCLIDPTAEDSTLAEPTGAVRVKVKLSKEKQQSFGVSEGDLLDHFPC